MPEPRQRIIVALDGLNGEQAERTIESLAPHVGAFKVGSELITRQQAGQVADFAAALGASVFYDGKFHDIPQTVANASGVVAQMQSVAMFNVHCLGGFEMMQAARQAVDNNATGSRRPQVLGVTILTSHDYDSLVRLRLLPPLDREVLELPDGGKSVMDGAIRDLVINLAALAQSAGLDGVVASPKEIEAIRKKCGPSFLIVTPGVRPVGADANDQKRVMTPSEAIACGADYLVIGRPILKPASGTLAEAAARIADEIATATAPCPARD